MARSDYKIRAERDSAGMADEATLSIGDEEYVLSDLTVETQKQVGRVARLRDEIENLQVQLQEREVVLRAYSDAIVQAVKPVEDEDEDEDKAKIN